MTDISYLFNIKYIVEECSGFLELVFYCCLGQMKTITVTSYVFQ